MFTIIIFASLAIILFSLYYHYYQKCFEYWEKRNVATIPPVFPTGNITKPFLGFENLFVTLQNYYNYFKKEGKKHGGLYFFNGPIYFPIDIEIIRHILVTDFEYFVDRGMYVNEEKLPLTTHLFNNTGNHWRKLRAKLSPTFSSGKLKAMYSEIFIKNTKTLIEYLENLSDQEINSKFILQNFTTEIISNSAFGLELNAINTSDSEIVQMIQNLFYPPAWKIVSALLTEGGQNPGNLVKALHDNPKLESFLRKVIQEAIDYREKNHMNRVDFLSLLLEIRDKEGLTFNEILAQSFLFFAAGLETSSTTMSFCLHELAHNQEIQKRLREEIFQHMGRDFTKFTYDDIMKMPYLDQVVKETLRLYPVAGVLNRICVKTYKVPKTNLTLEKGTPVIISGLGIHRDPEYFPNPMKFDPERFNPNNSKIIPYTFMPFGEGPRICIGMRYGYLQTKLGVAAVLSKFEISPSDKTPKVIEFDKITKNLVLSKQNGLFVKVKKL